MAEPRLEILDKPEVKHPERRRLHAGDCRWAFSPNKKRPDLEYRDATAEELRTHARCSHCC